MKLSELVTNVEEAVGERFLISKDGKIIEIGILEITKRNLTNHDYNSGVIPPQFANICYFDEDNYFEWLNIDSIKFLSKLANKEKEAKTKKENLVIVGLKEEIKILQKKIESFKSLMINQDSFVYSYLPELDREGETGDMQISKEYQSLGLKFKHVKFVRDYSFEE